MIPPSRSAKKSTRASPVQPIAANARTAAVRIASLVSFGMRAGDEKVGGIVEVFALVVVKFVVGDDLPDDRRGRVGVVAEHGAFDLRAQDRLFHHHLAVVAERLFQGGEQPARSFALPTPTDEPVLAGLTNIG